jgi:DNA-binding MarR family transcriptional regulator
MPVELEEEVLIALRRITRAIDLHSRKLANTFGLTGPQLVCLRALARIGQTNPGALAKHVALSQGTVTGIVDRLLARQLVTRERNPRDRRQVTLAITSAGRALVEQAPSPLQERFLSRLSQLSATKQTQIRDTLGQIATMMGGDEIEAAPVLSTSPAAQSTGEVRDVLEAGETDVAWRADIAPKMEVSGATTPPSEPPDAPASASEKE